MRTTCGLVLLAAVGCGGGAQPTTPDQHVPLAPHADSVTPVPSPSTALVILPPPPAPAPTWELDPAKHALPAAPAAGSVLGKAFAPQAEFQADTLTFRTFNPDGSTDRMLAVKLPPDTAKAAAGGLTLVVRPTDPTGPTVPVVSVETRGDKKDTFNVFEFPAMYGLTLEFGKRAKGRQPGKLYLSLPGDAKDFLAGTFVADCVRTPSEPPGPDDAPFVQGGVTAAGAAAGATLRVGYFGLPAGKADGFVTGELELVFAEKGRSSRSDLGGGRLTALVAADAPDKAARYEHTRLPAGKYLVFATSPAAPPVGKWVGLDADGKISLDLALDPGKAGKLDVKVPAGATGKVLVVPADAAPVPPELFGAASALGLVADPKDGVATFARLAPGRYEIRLNDLTAAADVKANETAAVELVPPKK